jgi:zinc protease
MQKTTATAILAGLTLLSFARPLCAEEVPSRILDNGLEVLVLEKHQAPIVTIEIAVKTGAFTEDRETNGLSHLYEHMFFKGNARIPTQEAYMKRMSELGISFNGTTGDERVNYFITLPSKNLAAGMRFMADALETPLFNQEELEKERLVVIGEYDRNESSDDFYIRDGMNKAAYGDAFLRKNPIGLRETILRATREIMVKFKETFYIPNNAMLSIVGDVNPTEVQALVDGLFGPTSWKEGPDPHTGKRPPMPRLDASKAVVVVRERVRTPSLSALWNGPDSDRDRAATYAGHVWSALVGMGSGRWSKTWKDGGLATQASLGYRSTTRDGAEIRFNAQLRVDAADARETLLKEIAAMADDPEYFTATDLENAKNRIKVDRVYAAESGPGLSHSITATWASASLDYYRTYLEETGKVTLEDVRHFVRNYLVGRPYVIGLLTSPKANEEEKVDEKSLLGTPPEQRGSSLAGAVRSFKLANGVRAVVRSEPDAPVSALEVFVDGGAAYLTPETQGVERFAFACALEGSKSHPRDAMKRAMEALGAREGHEHAFDYSRVGVQAPSDQFTKAVDLVVACLKEPELDEKEIERKRVEIGQGLRRERQSPDGQLTFALNQVFYAKHAYENRWAGTPETLKGFDAAACRTAVAQAMIPSRVLLVLVSSMSQDDAKGYLEKTFGWIKAPNEEPKRAEIGAAQPSERFAFEKREKLPTTYVGGRFALPAPSEEGYAPAKVLMLVLKDRLWDSIRTRYALSYAPSAGMAENRANYGMVYVTAQNPKRAVEVMFEEMARLKDELVPAKDLRGAVLSDETRRWQRLESASGHALGLGAAELMLGGWHKLYDQAETLGRVTPEQVRDAARKYLKDLHWGIVGPEPLDEKLLAGGVEKTEAAPH